MNVLKRIIRGLLEGVDDDQSIASVMNNMDLDDMEGVSEKLEANRTEMEANLRKEVRKAGGGERGLDVAMQQQAGKGKGTFAEELGKIADAQERVAEMMDKEKKVQPVRVVGDFRLVDDDGNTVSLKPNDS